LRAAGAGRYCGAAAGTVTRNSRLQISQKAQFLEDLAKIDGFTYGDSDVNGRGQIRLAGTAAAA
jgi:hypothetical protein